MSTEHTDHNDDFVLHILDELKNKGYSDEKIGDQLKIMQKKIHHTVKIIRE